MAWMRHRLRGRFVLRVLSKIPDYAVRLFQPDNFLFQLFKSRSLSAEINRARAVNFHFGNFFELFHCGSILCLLSSLVSSSIAPDPKEN